MRTEEGRVGFAEEGDRLQVFVAPMDVGDPVAWLAAVVEVKHGGYRIHSQPIDVVTVEPEERVGEQIIRNFPSPEIVDQRVPIPVKTQARVLVLVERRAVKTGQTVRIGGKMRGHPVDDHAEARLVRTIDKAREVRRTAETAGRCVKSDRLIAPGTGKGVLADRQTLDVGEAQ